MEFPVTINSQDEFDGFVKDRIARVEAKFSDYDELKTKAEQSEAAIAAVHRDHHFNLGRTNRAQPHVGTIVC